MIVEETLISGGGEESTESKTRDSRSVLTTGRALAADPRTAAGMLNCGVSVDIAGVIAIPEEQHGLWLLCE